MLPHASLAEHFDVRDRDSTGAAVLTLRSASVNLEDDDLEHDGMFGKGALTHVGK